MRIIEGLDQFFPDLPYPALTIGNFDGVHLGHQQILRQAAEIARRRSGTSIAMTFWPDPSQFFAPERHFRYLTDTPAKCALMEEAGIEIALIVPFNREFSLIEAEDFVEKIVFNTIRAREVVVGFNFCFGRGRTGTARFLQERARSLGYETHVVGPFHVEGEVVSSTRIRSLLHEGQVERAANLLGREYGVEGEVVQGARRGAGLGFPTANLQPGDLIVPAKGVYVARMVIEGEIHPGVVNVGVNPTFGGEALAIEAHLFDFGGDLYGKQIQVRFCRRLRPERKFPSVKDLVEQVRRDVEEARRFFLEEKRNAP
ncbi:MAG: bifunctional riboflavin kinase/FAD synthetase [Nitrospinota bacterium]